MITILRTDSENEDFRSLVNALNLDLAQRNGDANAFFMQFNKLDGIPHVVVAYRDGVAVGCGAMKPYDNDAQELKRMFVLPERRGRGIAGQVLQELERWCAELGLRRCVLETGEKQPEAIRLYEKSGYRRIPNYGQYADVADSVCFEKHL